jgi:hypothetical protein
MASRISSILHRPARRKKAPPHLASFDQAPSEAERLRAGFAEEEEPMILGRRTGVQAGIQRGNPPAESLDSRNVRVINYDDGFGRMLKAENECMLPKRRE